MMRHVSSPRSAQAVLSLAVLACLVAPAAGQQTQTQLVPLAGVMNVVELIMPATVPASPGPLSPSVPCHRPRMNVPLAGVWTKGTAVSAGTQTV